MQHFQTPWKYFIVKINNIITSNYEEEEGRALAAVWESEKRKKNKKMGYSQRKKRYKLVFSLFLSRLQLEGATSAIHIFTYFIFLFYIFFSVLGVILNWMCVKFRFDSRDGACEGAKSW